MNVMQSSIIVLKVYLQMNNYIKVDLNMMLVLITLTTVWIFVTLYL